MRPSELERGDSVHIDWDDLSPESGDSGENSTDEARESVTRGDWPRTYEVQDTDTEDLGLAEVVVVALVAGCDHYTLRQVGDNVPTMSHEAGAEREVAVEDIDTFESASELSYD